MQILEMNTLELRDYLDNLSLENPVLELSEKKDQENDEFLAKYQWLNSLKDGANYTQCMEFLSSFHSPTEEADLEGTAWEPDTEYKDYQWWLARSEGGEWELVTWGY